jgi:methylenetetrahydrofolate dehydrogenase (NADP+)/methenyltetrahydrofolate cyclohydrolase
MSRPKILDGRATARQIRQEVAESCAALLASDGLVPGLSVVLVGENEASQIYVRNKERAARKVGMNSTVLRLPADSSELQILETVAELNADASVHGILVQLPLPDDVDDQRVIESIDPAKDVDGFHPDNAGRLSIGLPGFVPCTPAGVIELLKRHEIDLSGKHAVVLGRSNIVGKPMVNMLLQKGVDATVTVCHSRTRNIEDISREADLLIAAIGRAEFVTGDMVKPGATVVDVGINRVEDASRPRGYRLVGDVAFEAVSRRAGHITPVPGGVGPMTIAMLLRNTLQAARYQVEHSG